MVCRTHWNDVSDDKTTPENAILFVSTRDHKGNKGSGTRLLKRLTLVHCAWSLVVCNRKGPGVENGGEPPNASLETAEKDWFSNLWWLFKVNCLHSLSRESSCQTASFGTPRAVARVRRNRQRKIKLENFFRPLPSNSTYYHLSIRLQNSPYFCVFKYARVVKQKVWNEAENRERDWGETLKIRFFSLASHARRACEARALRARKILTPRFIDFFTDFEKKTDCFAVYLSIVSAFP